MNRWVIVPDHHEEPLKLFNTGTSLWVPREACPFCEGHESYSPVEILVFSGDSQASGQSGWQVRVVANRVPALRVEGALEKTGLGLFDIMNGIGAHEVVIETPDHDLELPEMSLRNVEMVIRAWMERSLDLRKDKRLRSIQIFKSSGFLAGAVQSHAHSQIIAMPVVPKYIEEELEGARRYMKWRDRCVFCDILKQEIADGSRIVAENRHFAAIAPFAARFPFEIWMVPKIHLSDFASMSGELLRAFAEMYRDVVRALHKTLEGPDYIATIHSEPVNMDEDTSVLYHWHMEIIPRITRDAGFESGTGMYRNPVQPEAAAAALRSNCHPGMNA